MEAWLVALLSAAAVVAGFIDSQVGGGGVITLPSILAVGVPPHLALGTNKLAGTSSALVASINYVRSGKVPQQGLWLAAASLVGGAAGSYLVLQVDGSFLLPVVLVLMAAMTVYVLARPRFGAVDRTPGPNLWAWGVMSLAALLIGFYDGILGPGTGSFLIFALVTSLGFGFVKSAALGRVLNFASNAAALAVFIWHDSVVWEVGIPMAVGMGAGGWIGSHTTIRHGERFLKPLFVLISLALMVRIGVLVANR